MTLSFGSNLIVTLGLLGAMGTMALPMVSPFLAGVSVAAKDAEVGTKSSGRVVAVNLMVSTTTTLIRLDQGKVVSADGFAGIEKPWIKGAQLVCSIVIFLAFVYVSRLLRRQA